MYYKFETFGLYCGTSETEVPYSTSVAPPDENITAKWVWNHVNWVGLPLDWEYVPAQYNEPPVVETPVVTPVVTSVVETPAEETPVVETPVVETPAEETPTEPTA